MADDRPPVEMRIDVPHSARVWNYWLGGKDNYGVDREMGDQIAQGLPTVPVIARQDRAFLSRAVTHLVGNEGIRQFLDIGTGLPTADNTHEVAQRIAPECRIVYVDNDPLVLVHARALLTSAPGGVCNYVHADLNDPDEVLQKAAATLDFAEPVAIMLLGIMHFIPDHARAKAILASLLDAVPSGSFLVISHGTTSFETEGMRLAEQRWNDGGGEPKIKMRDVEQVAVLFEGLDLLEPGVVSVSRWRPAPGTNPDEVGMCAAVARKP